MFLHKLILFKRTFQLLGVEDGDSLGISVTGVTPQEREFRDEEAHRTPPGKRPSGTERNGYFHHSIKKLFRKSVFLTF